MSTDKFTLVQTEKDFAALIGHLEGNLCLGVDFEGEWNLHRYGLHLCLIQVSDGTDIFIIDPLSVGELDPFLDILEQPEVKIISHGPQSDFVLMDYLFGRHPRNIFDTEKAAQLLGYENTSLSHLLDRHFGITKNMKVRVQNWNNRPLSDKMLAYAAKDVAYLHELHRRMKEELAEKGRLRWQQEECQGLEEIRYKKKEHPHLEMKLANKLSREEAHLLGHIFEVRDQIARKLDKPAYYIIPNSKLIELAKMPPRSATEWGNLKGVNPRVRQHSALFHSAVQHASNSKPIDLRGKNSHRAYNGMSKNAFFRLVDKKTQILEAIRDQVKEEYDIYPMILSMRNLKRVAYGEASLNDFKAWQREILLKKANELELDVSILMS